MQPTGHPGIGVFSSARTAPRVHAACHTRTTLRRVAALSGLLAAAMFGRYEPLHAADTRAESAQQSDWLVGAARVAITPRPPIRLHGYAARATEATEVAEPIFARAICLHQADQPPAVLIAVECLGISATTFDRVAERLSAREVAPERLALCATHTHNGPMLPDVAPAIFGAALPADQQQRVDAFGEQLVDRLVEAAERAMDAREKATLAWNRGSVAFAKNRRTEGGPVDHRLPVLVARRAGDGQLLALLATYACHCTTLGPDVNAIHGDWAGVAAQQLEASHAGLVALMTIGCGADANPAPRGGIELARQHGTTLAHEVERLLGTDDWSSLTSGLTCRRATVGLPFDGVPSREEWEQLATKPGVEGYRAQLQLQQLEQQGSIASELPYRVASWSFGSELSWVFLAGEVVVDYALRTATDFDGDRVWLHAYSNDAPCYIPSRRVRLEGGYEGEGAMVYYNQPAPLAPASEDLIVDTIQRLLPHTFYGDSLKRDFPPPLNPEDSLAALQTRPGMRVELVAAEPLVIDPVAFDWGPDGRLWVIEMHDYPSGVGPDGKPAGRVVVLSDTDGDATYDHREVFADGLSFPSGLKVWRDGILLTAAPAVWMLRDTDGDGRCDEQEALYEGFGEGNQQHRVNGLRWGLDNWLYLGNGDSGGKIRSSRTGKMVNVSGRDLRIEPDTGAIEPQSGQTQFGRTQDDWGEWFGNNNSEPLWHYVLDDHYLSRNQYVAAPSPRNLVPVQHGAAPVFPISRTLERFNDLYAANRFTSACSPMIYRDNLLGEAFSGNAFICEPVHNLVHREVLHRDGLSFSSERDRDELQSEFLASLDNWFRPVMVRTGPDGAIWVADMYRYVIEHPTWIPEDFQRKMDVRAGDDRGRIYRILPSNRPARPIPRLDQLAVQDWVELLESPNGFLRDMGQQLLLWADDVDSIGPLREVLNGAELPQARLHALYTLAGLGALTDLDVIRALADPRPEIVKHAIRLSEPRLDSSKTLLDVLLKLADDDSTDLRIQLQLAYSLGASHSEPAAQALARIYHRSQSDPYLSAAALSSIQADNVRPLLETYLGDLFPPSPGTTPPNVDLPATVKLLTVCWRTAPEDTTARLLPHFTFVPSVAGGARQLRLQLLSRLVGQLPEHDAQPLEATLPAYYSSALQLAADPDEDATVRSDALHLLARIADRASDAAIRESVRSTLLSIVRSATSIDLQREALQGCADLIEPEQFAQLLRDGWGTWSPSLRSQAQEMALRRVELTRQVLEQLATGHIVASEIDSSFRTAVTDHAEPEVRTLARTTLGQSLTSNRQTLIDGTLQKWTFPGSREVGTQLFERNCSACHRLGESGRAIGPDLAALTDRSPLALLTAILDPNRAVEDKFLGYVIQTSDGVSISGLITQETSNQVSLATAEGKDVTVLRSDIELIRATGKSFMPEGLEQELPPDRLADLVTFLRSQRPPSKTYPNHQPRLIEAEANGQLQLTAEAAYIYGGRLIFEQKFRNLGWWEREGDQAVWEIQVPADGRYRVELDYACGPESAGSKFRIAVGEQQLVGTVESTGSWEQYRRRPAGTIELAAGIHDVVVTDAGRIANELFDLRSVQLSPVAQ